jgi:anti-sigma factor RsiW
MTDCPNAEIRDLLPDLVHGTLAGATRLRVEQHVGSCAECAAEVALIRRARTVLSRGVPSLDAERIAARIPTFSRAVARRHSPMMLRIAASIVLVALGATTFEVVRRQQGMSGFPAGESATSVAGPADGPALLFSGRLSGLADEDLVLLLAEINDIDGAISTEPVRLLPVPAWNGVIQ